ncbi:Hypothetical predicted protein [Mytilus galloprovincialis]|uniref:G-protein coupled receptors family 1 profile domain-containing protein n=1 Tax=Mytilus galloprovincialis TaxID=29158 RepID=A0A8B6EPH6_MYTGA|nr:Hypothetical predicted protein [Mytilus galloprovincialis]
MAKMFSVLLFVSFSCLSEFGTTCAVYIEQNTTYRNEYGVSSKPTTTYIDDGGVSSEQTTTYIDDGGVSSKQTTTYIDDGGVSSDQTTTYIDDRGVSSEQTTTYIDNGGVSSEQTTTYIDDDGVSSKPTTTYIDDGGVSSEQTTTYIDDDGVSSKQTTTYINDGGVSSEQTTTYIHNGGISSEQTTTYIDHGGISSEQTTKFTDDYGVVSEQTTTYIDDDNVSSEQTTNYMYNYGVSLKTDIEINSVEKIKYTNRMKCEIIDLTDNVLPSASGMAYPVNKSGQSILIWFDDFNFLSLTISKNCVSLALHMFLRKIIDIAYLQDFLTKCPDGTFIQNMFCDSSLAYNVSYIKDVFPHFSNVQIYFTDKFDHCTAQFNVFLESENHLLTNADIYHFLTNETVCWKYVHFTYLLNVKFSLKEISDDRINLKRGFLSTHTSYAKVFVILKYQSCKEKFLHYIYWNGLHVKENDTYLLSIDNIITFNEENNCIQVRLSCPAEYFEFTLALPNSTLVYLESAIAVEVTLVNGFMLYIFLQKENRTPVTLLLSALAMSDATASILMTIPKCIAYQIYGNQIDYTGIMPGWYIFDYPQCIMYSFLYELKYTFHFVSVLITTLLCLQKTAALLFPMWSKRHLSNTAIHFGIVIRIEAVASDIARAERSKVTGVRFSFCRNIYNMKPFTSVTSTAIADSK